MQPPETLPLMPFERFMVEDDRPGHPMTFYIEMDLAGEVEPQALREAVEAAVTRNPLLCARLVRGSDPHWALAPAANVAIDKVAWNASLAPPRGASIDLTREPGIRLWWASDAGQSKIWLQLHHACSDGQGARRFIVDFFTAYARWFGGPAPKWDRLSADRLLQRGHFPPAKNVHRTGAWEKLRHAWDFHVRRPSPLAMPSNGNQTAAGPLLLGHAFGRQQTATIRQLVHGSQGTLNDVALALLLGTLADWNRRHGRARDRQRLRILVPVDLRTRADLRLPSANRIGFAFLTRRIGDCDDHEGLLASIRQETQYVKQTQLALDFIEGLAPLTKFPAALRGILKWSGCLATAVLTNLDDPSRRFLRRFSVQDGLGTSGNLTLRRLWAVPPIRPGTRAGFGLCCYGGELTIGLNADASCFDVAAAGQLLDAYVERWHWWCKAAHHASYDVATSRVARPLPAKLASHA